MGRGGVTLGRLSAGAFVLGLLACCRTDPDPTPEPTVSPEPEDAPDELKVAALQKRILTARPLKTGRWIRRESGPQTIKPIAIRRKTGEDWPLSTVVAEPLPGFGAPTSAYDRAPNVAAGVTILQQRKRGSRSTRYLVYDLQQRQVLLEAPTTWPAQSPHGVLLYADDDGQRHLYDLRQKRPLHPRAIHPPGVVSQRSSMAMHAPTGRVVITSATTDRAYIGLLDPLEPDRVFLNIESPFFSDRVFGNTATLPSPFAWQAFKRMHRLAGSQQVVNEGRNCPLLSLHDKLGPVCRPHPEDMNSEKLVNERYRVDGDHVFDDVERVAIRLGKDCPRGAHIIGHWRKPARVLSACLKDNAPWFELWSPHHSLRFSARGDIGTFRILKEPVRSLQYYRPGKPSVREPYVEVFVDLERARVFTGGELSALPFSESFGHRRHILSTSPTAPRELWHTDLTTATATRIAQDHGCKKPPHHVAESEHRHLIACVESRSIFVDGPSRRRATKWTEVVDLKNKTRTRIDGLALPVLADDSRLVVGNDKKSGRVLQIARVP